MWYPENKDILEGSLKEYLKGPGIKPKKLNGIIVPHAGYEFSGAIAGGAFALLKGSKVKKAIILGPSHYIHLNGAVTSDSDFLLTPLGKIKTFNVGFARASIQKEHSISNQVPFLQKVGMTEVMPLMVGEITSEQGKGIAEKIAKEEAVYIFSTDLSHFLAHNQALKTDHDTIKAIEDLDEKNFPKLDACGLYPLQVLLHLCRIKKTKPHLIKYKNSGDITGDKSRVVGYASFYF